MKEKLAILMEDTGLRVGELAAKLDVKAPVISHILSGRNQPSFALTSKIISTFKQYNPYWWLGTSEIKLATSAPSSTDGELKIFQDDEVAKKNLTPTTSDAPTLFENFESSPTLPMSALSSKAEVERVIVIYSDKSFETFTPRR